MRRSGLIVTGLCCLNTFGAPVHFASPDCGGAVSGIVSLNVTAPGASRVVYSIGSHAIGTAAGASSTLAWNSNEAMDGTSAVQAVAYDGTGAAIGSSECVFTIANRGASLSITSPDLTEPLSGTATIVVAGSDTIAFPAVWTLNIDGEEQQTIWTDNAWKSSNSARFQLDTTRFANGPHELHVSMNSRTGPQNPTWVNWRGMVNRVVHFANGKVVQDVVPEWQNIFLAPGASANLGCAELNTDGSRASCTAPGFTVADSSIATVDGNGTLHAAAAGFTTVMIREGNRTATAHVWVTANSNVPHFSGSGNILNSYDKGQSLFVLAPFFLDPPSLQASSTLERETKLAGINTLGFGIYVNPRDTNADYGQWQATFDQTVAAEMDWAKNADFHLLLTGDDIFRRIGQDAWFTLNWPSARQALSYAVRTLAGTGVGVGIEGIDEASMIWGARPVPEGTIGKADYLFNQIDCAGGACQVDWPGNPIPNGFTFSLAGANHPALNTLPSLTWTASGSGATGFTFQTSQPLSGTFNAVTDPALEFLWFGGSYCGSGAGCNPPVPNNALATMRDWIRSAAPVPMSFPCLASDGPAVHGNWMGPSGISDYASHYFTSLKVRTTYPWSEGIQEIISSMEQEFFDRQPFLMLDAPQLMLVSLAGPSYVKRSASSPTYEAGTDALNLPGVSPQHVSATMMDAAALGSAGVRLYFFESSDNLPARSGAPAGSSMQTGANPINLQTDSWRSMGYASAVLTRTLEPYLLGARLNSPAYGRNITAAARRASSGDLLLIVNGNDWQRSIAVDLTPYQHGSDVARYRISAQGIRTERLPAAQTSDQVILDQGESVAYVFPGNAARMPLEEITFSAPPGASVETAYLYSSFDPASAMPCGSICTLYRDPKLGPFFYRFVFPDAPSSGAWQIVGTKRVPVPAN